MTSSAPRARGPIPLALAFAAFAATAGPAAAQDADLPATFHAFDGRLAPLDGYDGAFGANVEIQTGKVVTFERKLPKPVPTPHWVVTYRDSRGIPIATSYVTVSGGGRPSSKPSDVAGAASVSMQRQFITTETVTRDTRRTLGRVLFDAVLEPAGPGRYRLSGLEVTADGVRNRTRRTDPDRPAYLTLRSRRGGSSVSGRIAARLSDGSLLRLAGGVERGRFVCEGSLSGSLPRDAMGVSSVPVRPGQIGLVNYAGNLVFDVAWTDPGRGTATFTAPSALAGTDAVVTRSSAGRIRVTVRKGRFPRVTVQADGTGTADIGFGAVPLRFASTARAPSQSILSGASDAFGAALAADGDTLFVGAPLADGGRGAAVVFSRSAAGWVEAQRLLASDPQAYSGFGGSLVVAGDLAVVGARSASQERGAAYVLSRAGGVWSQSQRLAGSADTTPSGFGSSLAISGTTLLVGAMHEDAAYVFERQAGGWVQTARLVQSEGPWGFFGISVGLEGDTAVVGAPSAGPRGGVWVFTRTAGEWIQRQRLQPPEGSAADDLGSSVAISGGTILAGAHGVDGRGGALVFAGSGGSWTLAQELSSADSAPDHGFGAAVWLAGDSAFVSAPGRRAVYAFSRSGGSWTGRGVIGSAVRDFGLGLAVTPSHAFVGGTADGDLVGGAVLVYERPAD